eukprot:16415502-Heterocapsa_arctica.AAC.1
MASLSEKLMNWSLPPAGTVPQDHIFMFGMVRETARECRHIIVWCAKNSVQPECIVMFTRRRFPNLHQARASTSVLLAVDDDA